MKSDVFRKSSLERVSSPEQLNDYIKVSNPSVWMVILALVILLGAAGVWAFTGTLPTTTTAKGFFYTSVESGTPNQVVCFLTKKQISQQTQDKQSGETKSEMTVKIGQKVEVIPDMLDPKNGFINGTIKEIGSKAISTQKLQEILSNTETQESLQLEGNSFYQVIIALEKDDSSSDKLKWSSSDAAKAVTIQNYSICNLSILTEAAKPTDFLFN